MITSSCKSRKYGRWAKTGNAGFTLIEVLVAVVILGIGSAGIALATVGSLRSSHIARMQSDMNVLATSFGEAVKSLPYTTCASPQNYYDEFSRNDQALPEEIFQLIGKLDAQLEVLTVTDRLEVNSRCPGGDSGVQQLTLRASNNRVSREITITKRNPALGSAPPYIDFEFTRRSGLNSPIVEFGLQPVVSSEVGIYRYEWWCYDADNANDQWMTGPDWASNVPTDLREPDFDYTDGAPLDPKCAKGFPGDGTYSPIQAPPKDTEQSYWAAMRVTDNAGITWPLIVRDVIMPTTDINMPPSTAGIEQLSTPQCTQADPCTVGEQHTFDGTPSQPGDGTFFIKCLWTFSDGADPEIFLGQDCTQQAVTHTFYDASETDLTNTWVRLSVTDSLGRTKAAIRYLEIHGVPVVPPTVVLQAGTVPQSAWSDPSSSGLVFDAGSLIQGRVKQKLYLSGVGSQSNNGGNLTYEWQFSDASDATRAGMDTDYLFIYPSTPMTNTVCVLGNGDLVQGAFRVRLTVTDDSNNAQASATVCVRVGEDLAKPPVFAYLGVDTNWCPTWTWGFICHLWEAYSVYQFRWSNVPMAPGDTITFRVRIQNVYGLSCIVGEREFALNHNIVWNGNNGTGEYRQDGIFNVLGAEIQDLNYRVSTSCMYQVQTTRTTAEGVQTVTEWSSPAPMKAGQ